MSGYVTKMVKNVGSQIEVHFFDSNETLSIVDFLSTFKSVSDKNCIQQIASV